MKVVTFGELMVRLQPYNYERFVQASTLEFTFGGGEANVAVSLANYGVDAAFVTNRNAIMNWRGSISPIRPIIWRIKNISGIAAAGDFWGMARWKQARHFCAALAERSAGKSGGPAYTNRENKKKEECICHGLKINPGRIWRGSRSGLAVGAGRIRPARLQNRPALPARRVPPEPPGQWGRRELQGRPGRQEPPGQRELQGPPGQPEAPRELLLRQYMHNTEIAVTMRLSTILKTIKQPL